MTLKRNDSSINCDNLSFYDYPFIELYACHSDNLILFDDVLPDTTIVWMELLINFLHTDSTNHINVSRIKISDIIVESRDTIKKDSIRNFILNTNKEYYTDLLQKKILEFFNNSELLYIQRGIMKDFKGCYMIPIKICHK